MQDVIVKLVSVFAAKDLSETPICFVCRQLDHQFVHLYADQVVIVSMEPLTSASVITGTLVIPTMDVKTLNVRLVPISNADHTLHARWQLACLNVFVKKDLLEMLTTSVLILMNALLPYAPTMQFVSTHPEVMIADVDLDTLAIHSLNVPKKTMEKLTIYA